MRKLLITKAGFSVVEMLIYMGVSAIFLVTLTNLFVIIANLRLESESTSAVEQDGQYLLSRIAYDVARSHSITSPALGSQGNTLQTDLFTYSLSPDGKLQVTDSVGTDTLSGTGVTISALNAFQHLKSGSADNVKVSFTITSSVVRQSGPEVRQFQTTVGTR